MLAPTVAPASSTIGVSPRESRCAAAARPTGPAPITATGREFVVMAVLRTSEKSDVKGAEMRRLATCPLTQTGDGVPQEGERFGVEAVTTVRTIDGAADDARLLQHLQVLGDGRLCQRQLVDQVADDALAAVGEELDDAVARGVGQRAEYPHGTSFVDGGPFERLHRFVTSPRCCIGSFRYRAWFVKRRLRSWLTIEPSSASLPSTTRRA